MAAIVTMARNHPKPEPSPNTAASPTLAKLRSCMNSEQPKIAQFTAISGRKMPSAEYKAGLNFSITISKICTMAAMMAMKIINVKKLKSTLANCGLIHAKAPAESKYLSIR